MDDVKIYILDQNFNSVTTLFNYKSFLWVERYNSPGDFEICSYPTEELLKYAIKNNYIWKSDSDYLMIIEELEITSNVDEGVQFIIRGRSLESILDRRIVWDQTRLRTNIQAAIKKLIQDSIVSPAISARSIPNFVFKDSTDSFITSTVIDKEYTGDRLLDAVMEICLNYSVGFRILFDGSRFTFELYRGIDRSYSQEAIPYVVFSPKYGNLINSDYFESIREYKNVTLVAGEDDENENRRSRTIGGTSGLLRRELYTDARDISSDLELINLVDLENLTFTPVTRNGVTISKDSENKIVINGTPTANNFTLSATIYTIPSAARGYYRVANAPGEEDDPYVFTITAQGIGASRNGLDSETRINNALTNIPVVVTLQVPNNDSMYSYNKFTAQVFKSNTTYYELVSVHYVLTSDTQYVQGKRYYKKSLEEDYVRFTGTSFQPNTKYYEIKGYSYKKTPDPIVNPNKQYFIKNSNDEYVRVTISSFSDGVIYYEHSNYNYAETEDAAFVSGKTYYIRGVVANYDLYSGTEFEEYTKYYEMRNPDYRASTDITPMMGKTYYTKDFEKIKESFEPVVENYKMHDTDYNTLLDRRGIEKLSEVQLLDFFDGEIDSDLFVYKKDYFIGDIVEIENEFSMQGKARVVEIINSYDESGIKQYPTFQIIQEEG